MWLHHSEHLYEMRSIVTLLSLFLCPAILLLRFWMFSFTPFTFYVRCYYLLCILLCKGTSRAALSHHWGSVLLVAHWQSCTRSHSSCLLPVCVMWCDAFYSIIRTLWLLIHVLMWWCVWSSSIEVYILASCRRSTSLESQLSFRDSYLAWGVIAFEWFPNILYLK